MLSSTHVAASGRRLMKPFYAAVVLIGGLLACVSAVHADRPADCPKGYTNNGATCGRGSHDYRAGSRVANCPKGYTNMGLYCQKSPPFGATKGPGSMTCSRGYFLNKDLGRCFKRCKSGYTNTGEFCHRPVSTLGMDRMTCRADEVKNGARCYAGSQRGESCWAGAPCAAGLSCQPGVHKCFDLPRKAGQPCVAGHTCGAGLYCQSFTQKCMPKTVSYNSNSPCGHLRVAATAEDARRANLTMSYGAGSAGGAGLFGSYETGVVYGNDGSFGCYATACFGSSSDVSVQNFANMGIYRSIDAFDGFSIVSGAGADTPFAEFGFQTSQVWSSRPPRSAGDFTKDQLIGTASGLSYGIGLNPVSVNHAYCFTEVLDDGDPLNTFRNVESAMRKWSKSKFDPQRTPQLLADLAGTPQPKARPGTSPGQPAPVRPPRPSGNRVGVQTRSTGFARSLDGYKRLTTRFRGASMCLDVYNGGARNNHTHLAPCANFSGQYWRFTPTGNGYYRLSTMFRGADMCLDVHNGGPSNNEPHLVTCANFSGQFWRLRNEGAWWRLTTQFRGDNMCLDIYNGGVRNNQPHLTACENYSGQFWQITPTETILERGARAPHEREQADDAQSNAPTSSHSNIVSAAKRALIGNYENHQYDLGGKNDWHYVTLTDVGDDALKWTNRAGASWTLTMTVEQSKLNVGADSPYYNQGHRHATVEFYADGRVKRISGPGGEWYDRNP